MTMAFKSKLDGSRQSSFLAVAPAAMIAAVTPFEVHARERYDATIVRTHHGIPHIRAHDFAGLGYGVGYTAGEDNGCIIAEQAITVRGERAQFFGSGPVVSGEPTTNLESDIYYRVTGDLDAVRRNFALQSADARALTQGFVAGYNRYLRDRAGRLPTPCAGMPWMRPINVEDALLIMQGSLMAPSFLRQIATAAPPGASTAATTPALPVDDPATALGSNGWAFGAEATKNKRGLLVGNPHYPWEGPNRFRQMHLTIPGRIDVMGAGLVATPFVGIGFNRDVAWTHTVTTARHSTLFELKLDPADPTAYLVDGRSEPMMRRTITLLVKDGQPVTRTVYATRYGPVVSFSQSRIGWTKASAFAVRDANLYNQRGADTWLAMGRARTVRELRAIAGRTLGIGFTNTIAADRHGDTLYADVTPVPNVSAAKLESCGTAIGRVAAAQRTYILDGSRSACDWDVDASTPAPGLMPERLLPTLFRRDFVQNSNDSYWLSNPAAPLPAASPLLGLVSTRQSFRTQSGIVEIQRALAAGKMTHERARDIILSNKSLAAERTMDDLLLICAEDATLTAPCTALRGWDREAELTSRGAVLFFSFLRNLGGSVPDLYRTAFNAADPVGTPRGLNPAAAAPIKRALAAAAQELTAAGIPLDAPLGTVQSAARGIVRIPIHGGPHAAGILNLQTTRKSRGGLEPVHGTSYIQVVSFEAGGPVADTLLSYSQSTDPASPHFQDQTRAYSEKRWHRLPFTKSEVRKAALGPARRVAE